MGAEPFWTDSEEERRSFEQVRTLSSALPRHLAFIMDGNRRYAKRTSLTVTDGHRMGAERMHEIVRLIGRLDIPYMTVYAFSAENHKRSALEVRALMELLLFYLDKYDEELAEAGVRLRFLGAEESLSPRVLRRMREAEQSSRDRRNLQLQIAFNYGSRQELLHAAQRFAAAARRNPDLTDTRDPDVLREFLYLPEIPDPDYVIRTGGELRLSNFLLWQSAYAELYFTETLWPELTARELLSALERFAARERRFGGTL